MKNKSPFLATSRLLLTAIVTLLVLSGCSESFSDFDAEQTVVVSDSDFNGKVRHRHLMPESIRFLSRTKTGSGRAIGLIVKFDRQEMQAQRILERYKVLERYEYDTSVDGYALTVEDTTGLEDYNEFFEQAASDPLIEWIESDFTVETLEPSDLGLASSQIIPWGISSIGGEVSSTVSGDGQGSVGVDIYLVDSGVNAHDLNVVESVDFRDGTSDPADVDGHGTHVAGTIAAMDNLHGVVGVAPGARIHNMKVLGDDGRTDVSSVIAAVEYITNQKLANPSTPMVVNLSLGEDVETTQHTALDEAITFSIASGVIYVASAGNEGEDASMFTPAGPAECVAGAIGNGRSRQFGSKTKPPPEIFSPGACEVPARPTSPA